VKIEKMNYELLRPFDPSAATVGDPIANTLGVIYWEYVAGPDAKGNLCVKRKDYKTFINPEHAQVSTFCTPPLAWVEGKPVYPGDTLYWTSSSGVIMCFVAGSKMIDDGIIQGTSSAKGQVIYGEDGNSGVRPEDLTWTAPKTKVKLLAFIESNG
jgi:hypothetical protein